jgi:hypothetical protein
MFVHATRIVEQREQSDYIDVCAIHFRNAKAIL